MKNVLFIFALSILAGCATSPKVETTKPWEGHYFDTNSINAAIQKIQLEKKESVWILSNSTLKRLLTNVGER